MNNNYNNKMKEIIKNMDGVKTILLHSCCAPCSSHVLSVLSNFFKVTVLYYNPNIEPQEEYEKRKKEQIRFIEDFKGKYPISYLDVDYENEKFRTVAKGLENEKEGKSRCIKCFYLRLEKTATLAKNMNFDFFGTTLTVSPYKNSQAINSIGSSLENKYNINFLYSDFKKENGYKNSIELSKKYSLYRQDYCGCLFSKKERDSYLEKNS